MMQCFEHLRQSNYATSLYYPNLFVLWVKRVIKCNIEFMFSKLYSYFSARKILNSKIYIGNQFPRIQHLVIQLKHRNTFNKFNARFYLDYLILVFSSSEGMFSYFIRYSYCNVTEWIDNLPTTLSVNFFILLNRKKIRSILLSFAKIT